MGSDSQHVRFTAECEDGSNLQCVLFNRAPEFSDIIGTAGPVRILGTADCKEWRGNKQVQLIVDEIEPNDKHQ
jgi:hypothetical protein